MVKIIGYWGQGSGEAGGMSRLLPGAAHGRRPIAQGGIASSPERVRIRKLKIKGICWAQMTSLPGWMLPRIR